MARVIDICISDATYLKPYGAVRVVAYSSAFASTFASAYAFAFFHHFRITPYFEISTDPQILILKPKPERMNRLERCLAGICMVAFPLVDTFSQSAVVTAGGDATGPNGSVAYSIGQYDYDHFSSSTGSINLGVQQPDFVIIIGTEDLNGLIDIKLYPNPVSEETNLHMEEEVFSNLHQNLRYELYDLTGKLLVSDKIYAAKTIVRTTMLHNGEYIIRVLNEKQDLKTFKIVKSN